MNRASDFGTHGGVKFSSVGDIFVINVWFSNALEMGRNDWTQASTVVLHMMLLPGLSHRFSGPHHLVQVFVPALHPQLLLLLVFAQPIVQVPQVVSFVLFVLVGCPFFCGGWTTNLDWKGSLLRFLFDTACENSGRGTTQ